MNRLLKFLLLLTFLMALFPQQSPAPLIWRRGEGWTWERGGVPLGANPKEQLELGRRYEQNKQWDLAVNAYRRLLKKWPASAFAAEAQYRIGVCLENQELYAQAVEAYQKALENYPNTPQFREILERQFKIGNLFLSGARHRVWKLAIFPGLDKAVDAYQKVIKNAPNADLAPEAQFRIGLVREKQGHWPEAITAYQTLLDKYYDSAWVDDAMFQLGVAYYKQSRSADYDKDATHKSMDSFNEFMNSFPNDERVARAKEFLTELNTREAEGLYKVAKFYDGKHKERAALIYYSELVRLHRDTEFAQRAIPRLEELKAKLMPVTPRGVTAAPAASNASSAAGITP
jgi:outer membrane assembly lipoprotein YfiO